MSTNSPTGNVLLVDDEPEALVALSSEMADLGLHVSAGPSFDFFLALTRAHTFDAAFLDWELDELDRGSDMLQHLCQRAPETARAVLTKHTRQRDQALNFGADVFIEKSMSLEERLRLESQSVELGLLLRIVAETKRYDGQEIPAVPRRIPIDPLLVQSIRPIANTRCDELIRSGSVGQKLSELLYRASWRPRFPLRVFQTASWGGKFALLTDAAALDDSQTAQICGCDPDTILAVRQGHLRPNGPDQAVVAVDSLLSILSFVLEMADYDKQIFNTAFEELELGRKTSDPPPWHGLGLRTYLGFRGPIGLRDALAWIRRQ